MLNTKNYYHLKWIAIIFMFIDHIRHILDIDEITNMSMFSMGRIAFPLFAFMLVESFFHTKSRGKHLLKLFGLAVISEIPYDLFTIGKLITPKSQNVIWTLALGYVMMLVLNIDLDKKLEKVVKVKWIRRFTVSCLKIDVIGVFMLLAWLAKFDYYNHGMGILLISFFFAARRRKPVIFYHISGLLLFGLLTGNILFLSVIADFVIITIARKKKDSKDEYSPISKFTSSKFSRLFCTWFYPAHLALLALFMI